MHAVILVFPFLQLHREGQRVADLGWVDFVFGFSTFSQILLGQMRIRRISRVRWWDSQDHGQPNPTQVRDQIPLPVHTETPIMLLCLPGGRRSHES